MHRRALVAMFALCAGCANVYVNGSTLAASTAALACDWVQTRSAAERGWHIGELPQHEANPLLGSAPSTRVVDTYFVSAIAVNAALWLALPRRWKSVLPGVIIGSEAVTIVGNSSSGDDQIPEAIMRRDHVTRQQADQTARQMRRFCRI